MDFAKIKALVKMNGDKFVMMENGEPEMVVMSFREYERLARSAGTSGNRSGYVVPYHPPKGASYEGSRFSGDEGEELRETEFVAPMPQQHSPPYRESDGGGTGLMPAHGREQHAPEREGRVRPEDIRLEDLPI